MNASSAPPRPLRLVVVDDDAALADTLAAWLEREPGLEFRVVRDGHAALALVDEYRPDVVLTDLKMPGLTGLELLKEIRKGGHETAVIVMTAFATAQNAVEAMKEGAYDYVIKPFKMVELRAVLDRLAHARSLERQNRSLKRRLARYEAPQPLVGSSPEMARLRELAVTVAGSASSVLITGESGTGKSMLAGYLHRLSARAAQPFVTIECAAIPRELLESELFGHEKGAFTGATARKPGRVEQADGGTLFLDEIGDMPLDLQAKILRVLQERELTRVGGTRTIAVDVRLVAATNKDLGELVRTGAFREDLFYRLNVIPVRMPALRERPADLPELAEFLLRRLARRLGTRRKTLAPEAVQQLLGWPWPGNVRELENTLERSMILEPGPVVPRLLLDAAPPAAALSVAALAALDLPADGIDFGEVERLLFAKALARCGGDTVLAARLLRLAPDRLADPVGRR